MITLWGSHLSDRIESFLNRPVVTVTTTKKVDEINITIATDGDVNRISISYPVRGLITNVIALNDITDALPVMTRVFGPSTQDAVQNKLEAIAEPLKPRVQLNYKIIYTPAPADLSVADTQEYQISYSWNFKGETLSESEWRSVENDHEAGVPPVLMMGGWFSTHRALSPAEAKTEYEKGPEKRDF